MLRCYRSAVFQKLFRIPRPMFRFGTGHLREGSRFCLLTSCALVATPRCLCRDCAKHYPHPPTPGLQALDPPPCLSMPFAASFLHYSCSRLGRPTPKQVACTADNDRGADSGPGRDRDRGVGAQWPGAHGAGASREAGKAFQGCKASLSRLGVSCWLAFWRESSTAVIAITA